MSRRALWVCGIVVGLTAAPWGLPWAAESAGPPESTVPVAPEVPIAAFPENPLSAEPWRVVLIRGWDAMYPVNVVREQALRAALLDKSPRVIEIYPEEIDSLRFPGGHGRGFDGLLAQKYAATPIDLIIASGLEPLDFAIEHRDRIWKGAPIVFNGVIEGTLDGWKRPPRTTGLTMTLDVAGTLALGLALVPHARRVYFVAGVSDFDQMYLDVALRTAKAFQHRLEIRTIDGLPMAEMLDQVGKVERDSIVVYLTVLRDSAGQINGPGSDFMTRMARRSPVPMLTPSQTQFRRGAVGGSSTPFPGHGRAAGQLARKVLEGADPGLMPVRSEPPPACELDWNALQRWKVPTSNIPGHCTVVNRPPSIWSVYLVPVLVMLSVILLQAALISAFLIQRSMRRRAESQLQARAAELAQASRMAMMGELTAGIAHEINQPIGAILGNAEAAKLMLEQGTLDRDKLREILTDIRDQDLRAGEVIQGLRNLMSRREWKPVPLDVNLEVSEALRHLDGQAERKKVRLTSIYGHDVPDVRGDSLQLQQVVINLVNNAVEAVAELQDSRRAITVETRAEAGGAQIAVTDRGPGLDPRHTDEVFQSRFTTKPHGMGFGLSIVRAIAEMHGGRVAYDSLQPQGARFTVWLPALTP